MHADYTPGGKLMTSAIATPTPGIAQQFPMADAFGKVAANVMSARHALQSLEGHLSTLPLDEDIKLRTLLDILTERLTAADNTFNEFLNPNGK